MVTLDPVIDKSTPILKNATAINTKFIIPTTQEQETAAFGDIDLLGITELELDQQCEELFSETPVKFVARKGHDLD